MSDFIMIVAILALAALSIWAYSNQACKQARQIHVRRIYEEVKRRPDMPFFNAAAEVATGEEIEHLRNLREAIGIHIELDALYARQLKGLTEHEIVAHAGIIAAAKRLIQMGKDAIIVEKLGEALDHCRNAAAKLRELSFVTSPTEAPQTTA